MAEQFADPNEKKFVGVDSRGNPKYDYVMSKSDRVMARMAKSEREHPSPSWADRRGIPDHRRGEEEWQRKLENFGSGERITPYSPEYLDATAGPMQEMPPPQMTPNPPPLAMSQQSPMGGGSKQPGMGGQPLAGAGTGAGTGQEDPEAQFYGGLLRAGGYNEQMSELDEQIAKAVAMRDPSLPGGRHTRAGFTSDNWLSSASALTDAWTGRKNEGKFRKEKAGVRTAKEKMLEEALGMGEVETGSMSPVANKPKQMWDIMRGR